MRLFPIKFIFKESANTCVGKLMSWGITFSKAAATPQKLLLMTTHSSKIVVALEKIIPLLNLPTHVFDTFVNNELGNILLKSRLICPQFSKQAGHNHHIHLSTWVYSPDVLPSHHICTL